MNLDYLFYLRPAKPGPYTLDDLGEVPEPIGASDAVRERIGRLFSRIDWHESDSVPGAWFGSGGPNPVFQFTVDADGQVSSFMGSRLERRQMLQLARAMSLIALELQGDVVFA
ncbi:hypothetical protein [Burkholderia alba]|uniref:hypothetical protein n=1 Tax=Burkholderia alba TaxID=2683677 RepID=UPI002B05F55F|nr:hypothetical protein [Burkholderia alba]